MRDSQRSKVYAAEWRTEAARRKAGTLEPPLSSIAECQRYVDGVLDSRWFRARWKRFNITVEASKGYRATAYTWTGLIAVGKPSRKRWVMLHEIAHFCAPAGESHGPVFAARYLQLVDHFLGADAARELRAQFVAGRVRHRGGSAKPKRTVETKTAAVAASRQRKLTPPTAAERLSAIDCFERLIAQGHFGAPGCKPRAHALEALRKARLV